MTHEQEIDKADREFRASSGKPEANFKAAKAAYDKAALAERRHQGSRAETDFRDKQMHAALKLWIDAQKAATV
jgi:hypothetical protein